MIDRMDKNGDTKNYKYDLLGRPVEEINALGQMTAYKYDAEGNLIEKLDRDGSRIQMVYDAVNNLKKVQYGSEKVVTYEHDGLGNVIEMLDWLGTTTFERDLVACSLELYWKLRRLDMFIMLVKESKVLMSIGEKIGNRVSK